MENKTCFILMPFSQAAELEEFNNNFVGQIEVTNEFRK